MISDAELLKLVMERYPEQPTPFIIEQFTVLKPGLFRPIISWPQWIWKNLSANK